MSAAGSLFQQKAGLASYGSVFADVQFILLRVSSFVWMLLGDWFVVEGMVWPVLGGRWWVYTGM